MNTLVLYAINNDEQFELFTYSIDILLKKNKSNFEIVILIDPREEELVKKTKKKVDSLAYKKIKINSIAFNNKRLKHLIDFPMIWWPFYLFSEEILKHFDYILWLDNDTLPFFSISNIVKLFIDRRKSESDIVFWGATHASEYEIISKYKESFQKNWSSTQQLDQKDLGNAGVMLINLKNYRSFFNKININNVKDFENWIESFVEFSDIYSLQILGKKYYCDEAFIWTTFENHISCNLPKNLNFSQFTSENYIDDDQEIILHWFIRDKEWRKFNLYKVIKENDINYFTESLKTYFGKYFEYQNIEACFNEKYCVRLFKYLKTIIEKNDRLN